jgi:hypothetical protein
MSPHSKEFLSILGIWTEARAEAAEILRISPAFSVEAGRSPVPWKDLSRAERYLAALRKAGLK